jgi:hypothetical protein
VVLEYLCCGIVWVFLRKLPGEEASAPGIANVMVLAGWSEGESSVAGSTESGLLRRRSYLYRE